MVVEDFTNIYQNDGISNDIAILKFKFSPEDADYDINVFTCEIESEKKLIEEFKGINDCIAFDFQQKLSKNIEKWNIYLCFFVSGEISEEIRYYVEQNKYATRKIVFSVTKTNLKVSEKEEIVKNKLFNLSDFKLKSDTDTDEKKITLESIVNEHDNLLLHSIRKLNSITNGATKKQQERKKEIINKFLELKK